VRVLTYPFGFPSRWLTYPPIIHTFAALDISTFRDPLAIHIEVMTKPKTTRDDPNSNMVLRNRRNSLPELPVRVVSEIERIRRSSVIKAGAFNLEPIIDEAQRETLAHRKSKHLHNELPTHCGPPVNPCHTPHE